MRRRPRKLQVDTFPFLAVLLCAMGSLILVLLVRPTGIFGEPEKEKA